MHSSTKLIAALSALGLTLTAGCQGLVGSTPLEQDDAGAGSDARVNDEDAAGGGEHDSGEDDSGGADVGGVDPCAGVSCGANSSCQPGSGSCACDEGFVLEGGACEAPAPGDPRARTLEQVCARWNQDYPKRATSVFSASGDVCDAGEIDPEAHADAMRRVNVHRWLLGLDAAGVNWGNQAKAQEAAMMMDVNSSLSHSPPSSWQCYTQDGADAAGSSNLGLGYSHPSDTVDGYMADSRTPSLGHRRWIISPTLDQVGFGHHGRGGAMWAFGKNSAHVVPEYVMYPGAGIAPAASILGDWSISSNTDIGTPAVTIAPRGGGASLPLGVTKIANNYGMRYAVSIQLGEQPELGVPYVITITLGDGTVWSHETTVVDCDGI